MYGISSVTVTLLVILSVNLYTAYIMSHFDTEVPQCSQISYISGYVLNICETHYKHNISACHDLIKWGQDLISRIAS